LNADIAKNSHFLMDTKELPVDTSHRKLASRYFDYLAKRFPVMCASDEFHFLPRAENASRYYDRLDNFEAEDIEQFIAQLKEFKNDFDLLARCEEDLEKRIDLELLSANAAGILIEFEMNRSWHCNPLLYLKIAFIGLDHALTKPADKPQERMERTASRLYAIPRLLSQAADNLKNVPDTYHRAASDMVGDCKDYLSGMGKHFPEGRPEKITEGLQEAMSALEAFGRFLSAVSPHPDNQFTAASLEASLKDHFLCTKSPEDVFQIAADEWGENINQLKKLQSQIDAGKSWQELYHAFYPPEVVDMDTVSLYRQEIERMRLFFSDNGFRKDDLGSLLVFSETPIYLRSVRGTASFSAAFSADAREKSSFFMTTRGPRQNSEEATELLKKRLHREYKFLTAHETIPGHHLLDSIRRRLENPIRRQIESPLFYEGWASYAESLLTDYGYVHNPAEYLVDYKRRLWRSARCQIDAGLSTGILSREDAEGLLTTTGFSPEEAKRQIDRFKLNPGYQVCYTLGCHEIRKLKEKYGGRMGSEPFHTFLLEGGELPFHLAEKRFEALTSIHP